MLSETQIRQMMPRAGMRLDEHLPFIEEALVWGKIAEPLDVADFFAQLAHESGEYKFMREIHDGSNYEGRLDLGNTEPGDGIRYPGRGGIQVTGRAAARAAGLALGVDFENDPGKMELPEWATKVSAWFWTVYKPYLQPASRAGWFRVTTKIVNGGYNGWADRLDYYTRNRNILKLPPYTPIDEEAAIIKFQITHGLATDGVGPITLKKLKETLPCL